MSLNCRNTRRRINEDTIARCLSPRSDIRHTCRQFVNFFLVIAMSDPHASFRVCRQVPVIRMQMLWTLSFTTCCQKKLKLLHHTEVASWNQITLIGEHSDAWHQNQHHKETEELSTLHSDVLHWHQPHNISRTLLTDTGNDCQPITRSRKLATSLKQELRAQQTTRTYNTKTTNTEEHLARKYLMCLLKCDSAGTPFGACCQKVACLFQLLVSQRQQHHYRVSPSFSSCDLQCLQAQCR